MGGFEFENKRGGLATINICSIETSRRGKGVFPVARECQSDELQTTLPMQERHERRNWFNYVYWGVYARTQLGVTDPIPLPWYRRC